MKFLSWWRPTPKPVAIPPYVPPVIKTEHAPKDDGLVVEEVDTSAMTRTGIHKAWKRLTGQAE